MEIFEISCFKRFVFWWMLVRWKASFWWDFLLLFQGISSLFGFSCIIFFGLFMLINGCFFLVTFGLIFWSTFVSFFLFFLVFPIRWFLFCHSLCFSLLGSLGFLVCCLFCFFPCVGTLDLGCFWLRFVQSLVFDEFSMG